MDLRTLLVAGLISLTGTLAFGQTQQDHESHHPNTAAEDKAPSGTQPQAPGGMMGGNSPMMGMMGNNMPMMMGMMQMMMGSGRMAGMGGMATIDRIEGRIAFLRAELKITDAQNDAWNTFANVLRDNAKKLGELRGSMTLQGTLIDRLTWQEKWLTARADETRAIRTAYSELAPKLSDEQKATADQILAPHMGMMTMMSGIGMGQAKMGLDPGRMPSAPANQMMQGNPMMKGNMAPKQ